MKLNSLTSQILSFLLLIYVEYAASLEYPWMYYYPYGNNVTLKPLFQNETEKIVIKTCKWILPNNVELIPGVYISDPKRYQITKYNCELTIKDIQKDTNGVYHCNINNKYISKAMLNIHGAPKASMLEEFTPNLIAGFSTFGGIIAFFAFTCGVYKFRYKSPTRNNNKDENKVHPKISEFNEAFKMEENEEPVGTELEISMQTKF